MRNLKIDYWRVIVEPDVAPSFEELLRQAVAWRPESPRRRITYRGKILRLQDASIRSRRARGQFVAIRVNDPATRGNREGLLSPINFQEGEGLAEKSAFLYSPRTQVLALERNWFNITSAAVCAYFERAFKKVVESIELAPILSRDAMLRLRRLSRATRFEVSISGGRGLAPGIEAGLGASELFDLRDVLSARNLHLKATVGHKWNSAKLSDRAINGIVRFLRSSSSSANTKVLKVSGRTEADERDIIDLVEERIVDVIELDQDEGRDISLAARLAALEKGLNSHREEFSLE